MVMVGALEWAKVQVMVGALMKWATVEVVVGSLVEVVGALVEWVTVEVLVSSLVEVVGSLWVMVGTLVEWATVGVVVGSLWVMVGALGSSSHEGSNELPCGRLLCLLGPVVCFVSLDGDLGAAGDILSSGIGIGCCSVSNLVDIRAATFSYISLLFSALNCLRL